MVWGAVLGTGLSLFGANKARKDATRNSKRLRNDGREAAEDVYFKPVGLTNSRGSITFSEGKPVTELGADYQNLQGRTLSSIYGLSNQFNNYDPQAEAQRLADQRYALMQPQMAAQQANLAQTLFGSGRGGLVVSGSGAGAGSGMVNPDIFGYNQAMAQQQAQIAADAQTQAFDRQAQLQGLLSGQFQQLGGINQIEDQLLAQALQLEAQRGQQAAAAGGIRTGTAQAAAGIQGAGDRAFTNALTGLGTGVATAGINKLLNQG